VRFVPMRLATNTSSIVVSRAQRFTLELAWQRLESECRTPKTATRSLCAVHQTWASETLRETLQAIYASPNQLTAERQLLQWCGWALHSMGKCNRWN
jgi:hypothetical protein